MSSVVQMLKNSPIVPTFTNINSAKCPTVLKTASKLEGVFGDRSHWPPVLRELMDNDEDLAVLSLGLAASFLEDTLILEKTFKPGNFMRYTPQSQD